jgi:hypothetical protein
LILPNSAIPNPIANKAQTGDAKNVTHDSQEQIPKIKTVVARLRAGATD